ncbi:MAG: phage tail protein [Alteromonadaceae bacterium]|nr:MAG: phage tail protein [Alteromonadaceae bacterium]
MSIFGLACEGVTDQIVIENILCGFFKDIELDDKDLDDEITYLQPPFDETTKTQLQGEFGGWTQLLLTYLPSSNFREDVLNCGHIIIQVDTDVSPLIGFDVPHVDNSNKELAVEVLVDKVTLRLAELINTGEPGFYEQHKENIIFCISVHSIECWLLALHTKNPQQAKIKNCESTLNRTLNKNYKKITTEKITAATTSSRNRF